MDVAKESSGIGNQLFEPGKLFRHQVAGRAMIVQRGKMLVCCVKPDIERRQILLVAGNQIAPLPGFCIYDCSDDTANRKLAPLLAIQEE